MPCSIEEKTVVIEDENSLGAGHGMGREAAEDIES